MNRPGSRQQNALIRNKSLAWILWAAVTLPVLRLHAAPPAWWSQRGATTANPADDFAAANIGQLKHMATRAAADMNDTLPGGAGTPINTLVQSWVQPPVPGTTRDDFAALTVGQLKSVARLFQARLIATQYRATYPAWLQGPASTDTELANLGQIKTAFAFDLSAAAGQLPDWWQRYYFNGQVGISPSADTDGDGLTNLSEYILSTNPSVADVDGDHDGLPDELELEFGTDPGNPSSGGSGLPDGWLVENGFDALTTTADSDEDEGQGDGLTLREEYAFGTDPALRDTDNDGVLDGPDGYAITPFLSPPRLPESRYAVISLETLGLPTDTVVWFLDPDCNIYYKQTIENHPHERYELRCFSPTSLTSELIIGGHGIDSNEISINIGGYFSDGGWVAVSKVTANLDPLHHSEVYELFRWKKSGTLEFLNYVPEFAGANANKSVGHTRHCVVNDDGTVCAVVRSASWKIILDRMTDHGLEYRAETTWSTYAVRWGVGNPLGDRIGEAAYSTYVQTFGLGYDPSSWSENVNNGNVFFPSAISASPERIVGQRSMGGTGYNMTGALYSNGSIISLPTPAENSWPTSLKATADGKLITFAESSPYEKQLFAREDAGWRGNPLTVWDEGNRAKSNTFFAVSLNDRREMVTKQGAIVRNGVLSPLSRVLPDAIDIGIPVTINSRWVILTDKKMLVPVEVAPDVLRVNADFDEQKLNTSTSYAKADCDDEDLKADAGPDAGKVIILDLHKGFFGVNPNTLPADFYTGATVTIEKLAEDDPETNQPELGEVRFYATKNQGGSGEQFWPIPITEPASGGGTTPKNLVPVIYAESATVPRGTDVQFWIEGMKAGPITLEFKYVKGSLTFSHKQKFLVATHQSKAEWRKEIIQQIKLQAGVDFTSYHPPWPSAPFMTNKAYI